MSEKPPIDPQIRVVRDLKKASPEHIRQLYMASDHVEWTPFAKSMKWDPADSRDGLPVKDWIEQKRRILSQAQAEMLAEQVFQHRGRWHQDVLKTLTEYPEANDAMLGILKHRINGIIQTINADQNAAKQAASLGAAPPLAAFDKIKTSELVALCAAVKIATESKHKSLLINEWSFKVAESYTDPKQFEIEESKAKDVKWTVQILGAENATASDMEKLLAKWYDKPRAQHTPEQLEAEVKAGGG